MSRLHALWSHCSQTSNRLLLYLKFLCATWVDWLISWISWKAGLQRLARVSCLQIAYIGKKWRKRRKWCYGGGFYCIFSCPPQKCTSTQYIFEQEEASLRLYRSFYIYLSLFIYISIIYLYIYTCLNEEQQQKRFGYTECESNPKWFPTI